SALILRNTELARIAEEVACGLAQPLMNGAGCFIRMPVMYPGGSSVVVHLDGGRDRFFVSDYGYGYAEADMMGATGSFARVARDLAERTGITFDARTFFVAESTRDELIATVAAVADCSQRAVTETALRLEVRKVEEDKRDLLDRLVNTFGRPRVDIEPEIVGASTISWPILALVRGDGGATVFDYSKANRRSAANIAAKNHGIARLDKAPRRIVAVRSKPDMGGLVALLSQSASVIEIGVPADTYRTLAA
ncbi:MAG TPA: hypothetical protein VK943_15170, partial [Arenibaculum sp.]|nr:hypothetical protein [Arenibaculum sp.]